MNTTTLSMACKAVVCKPVFLAIAVAYLAPAPVFASDAFANNMPTSDAPDNGKFAKASNYHVFDAVETASTTVNTENDGDVNIPADITNYAPAQNDHANRKRKPVDMIDSVPNGTINAPKTLAQCAAIASERARLDCFDELALQFAPKPALDLQNTFKSTIKGKPQVVLLGNTSLNSTPDTHHLHNNADSHHHMDASPSVHITSNENINQHSTNTDNFVYAPYDINAADTPLAWAYDLNQNSERGLWTSRPHNANYVLPLYLNLLPNRAPQTPSQAAKSFSSNQMRAHELKFQMSLKTKAAQNLFGTGADLWLGYTQLSHWQVYNEDNSRPFRAHDYEPEVFITQPISQSLPKNGRLRMLGIGAVHHSNGESDPLSRSWNRAYVIGGAEWGKLTVMPRIWGRILKKQSSKKPDDNPDILDYYGYGDVRMIYQLDKGNNISSLMRFNPKTGKGAVQIDYVFPVKTGVSAYVQLFSGYGQSLIDYNHKAQSIGIGVMLNDWAGL